MNWRPKDDPVISRWVTIKNCALVPLFEFTVVEVKLVIPCKKGMQSNFKHLRVVQRKKKNIIWGNGAY